MTKADLFPRLPGPFRSLAVTLLGMKVDRRRAGAAYHAARKVVDAAGANEVARTAWRVEREARVLARYAALTGQAGVRLEDLPFESKADLRARVERMRCAGQLKGTIEWSTGGTTGSPIDVPVTPAEDVLNTALANRLILELCMAMPTPARTAYLTGKVLIPADRRRPPFWVPDFRGSRRYYSMFHILAECVPEYAQDLARFSPDLIILNPVPAARLARFLIGMGWTLPVPPRGIWSMAEQLLAADREAIEAAFGCRVTDTYGMTEMAILAAECRFGTLHVCDLYGRTETIPAAGGLRELVGTSYVRTQVPVVRYRTGDLCDALEPTECRCGLPGSEIRNLRGRAVEVVELPDGRILTASPLADVLRRVPGMVWSRFEILAPDRWRLRYHAAVPSDDVVLAEVRRELARRAEGVRVEALWDPSPIPPPGKARLVVHLGGGGR